MHVLVSVSVCMCPFGRAGGCLSVRAGVGQGRVNSLPASEALLLHLDNHSDSSSDFSLGVLTPTRALALCCLASGATVPCITPRYVMKMAQPGMAAHELYCLLFNCKLRLAH